MGKAQSKRSVDITTETKKGAEDEITEKMEKIEDLDKKDVVNGDATISEKSDPEKKDSEEVENDKDMTTEKEVDAQAGGDSSEPQNPGENSKEEGGSGTAEEISPLADESIKKSKKEKVKKKWSFRSISFGKKDKQKPAKNEDATEDGNAATNGADAEEKTTTEPEDSQKEKSANENEEEKTAEKQENGNATPQELNGVEQNEEKIAEEKSNDTTANTTNNTTTTETCEPVQNETADKSSESSEKTENMATATTINNEIKVSENATDDDTSKNGIDEKMNATEQEPQKTDVANASVEAPSEKTSDIASAVTNESSASTNGEVVEKIHQNGDHGESEQEVVETSKAQIEVITNTDNKVSAATLDIISSTSINPSNVQIQVLDLNPSSEMPDEKIQIDKDESCIQESTEIEIQSHIAAQPSLSEADVSMTEDKVESNLQIETIESADLIPEPEVGDTEKSVEDKVGDEPSPPPLPISPPPSQVSVFAFTNNDESVENSIETKNSEASINDDEGKDEEIRQTSPSPSEINNTEGSNNLETNATHNEELKEETNPDNENPQTHIDEDNEKVELECDETNEEKEASVCKDMSLHRDDDVVPSSTGCFEDLQSEEEALIAAAVIDEITEKAAEIVGEQLKCNAEQITDEQSLQSNEERQEDKCNNEFLEENTVVGFDNEVKTNKDQHDDDDDNKIECEITNSSKETPLVIEQSNNITTECSSDFSASNSIQQDQDEMISVNKSDTSDEELLNPTKEFANAKDIKDNITVAEITQDLSVTCE